MPSITTRDGTEIYYKDWGDRSAQTIVFSHGWPLSSDDWASQMMFLSEAGYRTIAHDRRGHGRSSQPWTGNDMDTYADDLSELLESLDLHNIVLVGHSTGGGEVARYLGRHGSSRVAKAALVAAVTPLLQQTDDNPEGVPLAVLDSFREQMRKNRSQFFIDVPSGPFFGFNRPHAVTSQGQVWDWWRQGMACGFKNAYDCIKAFSETDFTEDLRNIDIEVLVLHGDDDQVVPITATGEKSVKLLKHGTLKVLPGAPHSLPASCIDEVNQELLSLLKSVKPRGQ